MANIETHFGDMGNAYSRDEIPGLVSVVHASLRKVIYVYPDRGIRQNRELADRSASPERAKMSE
jgi:hypothetical protein